MFAYCQLLAICAIIPAAETNAALPNSHAHNDYYHQRPLLDALDRGFCSVEADVFLSDGKLLVGHDRSELRPHSTLQSLYLDPLRRRVKKHQGKVHPQGPPLILLVDIKSEAVETYAALQRVLAQYADILSAMENGSFRTKAVTVVISGNRAKEQIAADKTRRAGIDGRLTDLSSDWPAHLLPLISDRWSSHFSWRGSGVMPSEERERLREIVKQAHQDGRRVRFWATPEDPAVWSELLQAEVDLIGTDDLDRLSRFLRRRSNSP